MKSQAKDRLTSARVVGGSDREFEDAGEGEAVTEEELGGVWRGELEIQVGSARMPTRNFLAGTAASKSNSKRPFHLYSTNDRARIAAFQRFSGSRLGVYLGSQNA